MKATSDNKRSVLKHGERPFDMKGEGLFAVIEDSAVKKTCGAELFDTYQDAWKHAIRQGLCPQGIFIRLSQIQIQVIIHQEADLGKDGTYNDMSIRK